MLMKTPRFAKNLDDAFARFRPFVFPFSCAVPAHIPATLMRETFPPHVFGNAAPFGASRTWGRLTRTFMGVVFGALTLMVAAVGAAHADDVVRETDPVSAEAADALSGASLDLSALRAPAGESERSFRADDLPARPGDFWVAFEDTGAGEDALRQSLAPLVESLRMRHPERRVVVTRIPSSTFTDEVRRRGIPFVMATSGTMVSLMQGANVVPLASRGRDAGALVIVRRNAANPELTPTTLEQLKGLRLAYADAAVFGAKAWLDARIMQLGEDPHVFWKSTERRARVLPDVLTPLSTGRIDAALLPGCLWERLLADGLIDRARFAPVTALRKDTDGGPIPPAHAAGGNGASDAMAPGRCLSTTVRYPDWMLGYAPSAPNETLRQLAAAVFETDGGNSPDFAGERWDFRVDLREVRDAMEQLEIGPWAHFGEKSLRRLIERHLDKIALALVLLLILVLHSVRANYLVRVRTAALTEALHERDRMEEEAKRGRERLSAVERAGIISQMSGMFAHELKQPLAAVRNYVGGLRLRADMTPNPDPVTIDVLSAIDEEAARAAGIVERVRSYAKAGARAHGETNLTEAVRRAVDYARRHDSRCAPVQLVYASEGSALGATPEDDTPLPVWGDALELELLVLNLVRNASHAATSNPDVDPSVRVSLTTRHGKAVVTVEDNGPALSDEAFVRLTGWGDSIKQEGLGIGLSICRGIADRHGAALKFTRREPCGIAAKLSVPLWDGTEPGAVKAKDGPLSHTPESSENLNKTTPSQDGVTYQEKT